MSGPLDSRPSSDGPAPATGRTAWFHCFAGTAGDMTMGALVHAGADPATIADIVGRLPLTGYALTFEPTSRCGIAATHALVVVHDDHEHDDRERYSDHAHQQHLAHEHAAAPGPSAAPHSCQAADVGTHAYGPDTNEGNGGDGDGDGHGVDGGGGVSDGHGHGGGGGGTPEPDGHDGGGHDHHRPYRVIREMIEGADLPERVRRRALRVFRALAEVEGAMHGTAPDDVEFHEVGSVDAIVDIVGACAGLESLGIDRIVCSPITVGQGTVRAAHGQLPNPAPATLELLARRSAPSRGIDDHRELATPTGVALMTVLADEFGPMPAMTISSVGYGAGTADIPGRPNVVQVVVGIELTRTSATPGPGQPVRLLEANVDDVTGEVLAHTIGELLDAGAHDAWATPIVMKKGRPAHTVHVLCDPSAAAAVGAVLVRETGTLGLRGTTLERWPQHRESGAVTVDGQRIAVKIGGGRVKVEHDDAAAAARALGRPLRDVLHAAETAARAGKMQT